MFDCFLQGTDDITAFLCSMNILPNTQMQL